MKTIIVNLNSHNYSQAELRASLELFIFAGYIYETNGMLNFFSFLRLKLTKLKLDFINFNRGNIYRDCALKKTLSIKHDHSLIGHTISFEYCLEVDGNTDSLIEGVSQNLSMFFMNNLKFF